MGVSGSQTRISAIARAQMGAGGGFAMPHGQENCLGIELSPETSPTGLRTRPASQRFLPLRLLLSDDRLTVRHLPSGPSRAATGTPSFRNRCVRLLGTNTSYPCPWGASTSFPKKTERDDERTLLSVKWFYFDDERDAIPIAVFHAPGAGGERRMGVLRWPCSGRS